MLKKEINAEIREAILIAVLNQGLPELEHMIKGLEKLLDSDDPEQSERILQKLRKPAKPESTVKSRLSRTLSFSRNPKAKSEKLFVAYTSWLDKSLPHMTFLDIQQELAMFEKAFRSNSDYKSMSIAELIKDLGSKNKPVVEVYENLRRAESQLNTADATPQETSIAMANLYIRILHDKKSDLTPQSSLYDDITYQGKHELNIPLEELFKRLSFEQDMGSSNPFNAHLIENTGINSIFSQGYYDEDHNKHIYLYCKLAACMTTEQRGAFITIFLQGARIENDPKIAIYLRHVNERINDTHVNPQMKEFNLWLKSEPTVDVLLETLIATTVSFIDSISKINVAPDSRLYILDCALNMQKIPILLDAIELKLKSKNEDLKGFSTELKALQLETLPPSIRQRIETLCTQLDPSNTAADHAKNRHGL